MITKKRFCQAILIRVLGAGTVLALASPVGGHPAYLQAFNDVYGTRGTKLDNCGTCHDSNYQNDYQIAVRTKLYELGDIAKALKAVEALDSDGDKFTNLQEIKARTLPGDPGDFPSRRSR
jgi:hypothetical protein